MTPIQLVLIIVVVLIFIRTIIKLKKKELNTLSFVLWSLFWFCVIGVVIYPNTTVFIANMLGVGRGADVVLYFAIALLFYLVFHVFIKLYKIERDITVITRTIALSEKIKNKTNDIKS